MLNWKLFSLIFVGFVLGLAVVLSFGIGLTSHPIRPKRFGVPTTLKKMESVLDKPGIVEFESINSANWSVPLAGLINLKRQAAKDAGLIDHDEPIHVYAHVIRHPEKGSYLIDTGVAEVVKSAPEQVGISSLVAKVMGTEKLMIQKSTRQIVNEIGSPLKGVFFTHLHLDHIAGMPDIPSDISLYIGPSESTKREFMNWPVRATTDRLFLGKQDFQEWNFSKAESDDELAVVDVFGDENVFVLNVPGHTPGSVAYVIRSTQGPILVTGDTCHTKWGWDNVVEPGDFSRDNDLNLRHLKNLKELAGRHPSMKIKLGHQESI